MTAEPAVPFTDMIDLASERLGAAVIAANDEFFAPKEALINPGAPQWREGEYTERGKWMDGWETRRRRTPGHDWAIIRLGVRGIVAGVSIDTSYFTGNYPEHASLDGCAADGTLSPDTLTRESAPWVPLLGKSALRGNTVNSLPVEAGSGAITHVRLNIFPDGGVARLRVHGEVVPDEDVFSRGREVDLGAMENGGFVVACSDMHYGHRQNLILPGRSTHMGDGWETRRRRGPGHDWTIVRLARVGVIERIEIDTDHFKGNAPGSCTLEWCEDSERNASFDPGRARWHSLLDEVTLQPHTRHRFIALVNQRTSHVRLNIFPDGGIARLRLFGRPAP